MRILFWGILVFVTIFRILTFKTPFLDGQKIRITAKILQEPTRFSYFQKVNLPGIKIYLPLFPEINYGDEIVVEGLVKKDELLKPKLISVKENSGIPVIRQKVIDFYHLSLPEPHASLVAGVTLGSKAGLSQDFWESLKKTGTAHIVVASGTNVTMVAGFLASVFTLFLKRRLAIPLILLGVWLYAFLSGFDAPIVRAAVMGSLVFGAQEMGRISESFRLLLITGFLMLIVRPVWIYDLGFALSFVASGSLIAFQDKINKKIKAFPAFFREGISTSLAAQIGVAPILFVTFGQFNILSPIINALVLWTVPLIMVLGGIAACLGLVFPAFGRLIIYLAYPLTTWFIEIVKIFS